MTGMTGTEALNALNAEPGQSNRNEFSSFKAGTKLFVKVLGTADVAVTYQYGSFEKGIKSFTAKNPSVKSPTGYPTENLTSWDKVAKYFGDKSEKFGDENSQKAYQFRPKQRFALGFFDLDKGEEIVIDLSKAQARGVMSTIERYGERLNGMAFELEKSGEGLKTQVTLMPVLDLDYDLTEDQRKNFDKAPESFDHSKFEGLLFESDDVDMAKKLVQAGVDLAILDELGIDYRAVSEGEKDLIEEESKGNEEEYGF